MAGRESIFNLRRLVSRQAAVVAFIAFCLIGAGLTTWRHQAAERKETSTMTETSVSHVNAASLISLNGRTFEQSDGLQGAVVGEYQGYFDGKTRSFTLQPRGNRSSDGKGSQLYSRSDPSGEVSQGAGFSFRVVRSALVGNAEQSATVTGEIELTNNTSATLYNTRIVFTSFKVTNAGGADAGNLPGANGFAYFNDGQVAYGGKLSVSRDYGDIAAAGKSTRVWSFAVANQPPTFFFTYRVIADLGVAAESVAPAAVQVNASSGTSVTISGRGFSGTPTVEFVPATGAAVAATNVTATATSITATVPAGTAAGIYSVRVTNPGGTAGGQGSSTIRGRLTVTGVPTNTLSGSIPGGAFAEGGAYLVTGAASLGSSTPIPPGTVIYVAGGATISLSGGGNINADGGIPGVSATAGQIVFTAQRSPGASVPSSGAWGGIDATSAATSQIMMRNVVVEYGGGAGLAGINISGSGRTLRFTDGIIRNSSGSGLRALGTNDSVVGFARNRIENNGLSVNDPALLLSGNAALGLYDLPVTGATIATSVGDASYYYSSANDFAGNQVNAVRIGTTSDAASNDFSESGVLVGQGTTPIQIAGDCSNPAIVGAPAPGMAELTITPSATIQLAADLNLQAGDYASDRVGCIAANGYAGVYLGSQPGAPAANSLITFDKIPSGGNFGAIFFARNAMDNCILNYVSVKNGGAASSCSLGNAAVISDGTNVKVTNSQVNDSATGGLLAISGAKIDSRGTTTSNTTPIIDTVIGGQLGDGNPGLKVNIITPAVAAADPMDRGVYFVDSASSGNFIRFFNTTRNTVTIGGMKVAPGTIRTVVGGGLDGDENVPGRVADSGTVTGLAVSPNGEVLYYVDSIIAAVRAWNASNSNKTIDGRTIASGNVGTLSAGPASGQFGNILNGLAVHPTSGDVYVVDATPGINRVFKIPAAGGAATEFAGNGATTPRNEPLSNGAAATSVPLLQPRALTFDPAGNLYIADTGHGRVARVDGGGSIFSVYQLDVPPPPGSWNNPHLGGLAFYGGKLYATLGNQQTIVEVTNPASASSSGTVVAGTPDASCDYSSSTCGDGGTIDQSAFNMLGSTATPPLASIASDSKGIFVLDQGAAFKGRIRYINLSANPVEVAGVAIQPDNINTVAGSGVASPFEGALASSADLAAPIGVTVDGNGNLWLTNSTANRLQFVNCGTTTVTIFQGTQAEQTVAPGTIVSVNKDVGNGPTDGAPVNSAAFDTPQGIVATSQGLFLADSRRGPTITTMQRRTGLIRFINTSASNVTFYSSGGTGIPITVPPGNIATIAGGGIGDVTDGANPTSARFLGPTDIAIHPTSGDIYVADAGQQTGTSSSSTAASRIRRINRQTGAVSTILTGTVNDAYTGLSFDSAGRLLVANAGRKTTTTNFGNSAILREKASGQCATTPAGCFDTILSGGTGSLLRNPRDVAEGKDGALYVTNAGPSELGRSDNKLLRIVVNGTTGTASVFSGDVQGYSGDGGPAANALLNLEATDFQTSTAGTRFDVRVNISILVTPNGEIIFSDSKNNAIRRIR